MGNDIVKALGAGSGIDTKALVDGLVKVEQQPAQTKLDNTEKKLDAQISAYGKLKSSLATFQGVMSPLANPETFNTRSVAFPDTDVITPTKLGVDAQLGSYQIETIKQASSQTLAFSNVTAASEKDLLGVSGKMTIQLGAWTYSGSNPDSFATNADKAALEIDIGVGDSLTDIAKKINDEKKGVQASVLLVEGSYQLMMTGPSGEKNALRITTDDPSLSNFEFNETSFAAVTETQQGQDAELKINGLKVTRESNSITDVIPGFEFTIDKLSGGEKISFDIELDKSTAEEAIKGFIEGYNTLVDTVKGLTGTTKDEDNKDVVGELSRDSTAKNFMREIRQLISDGAPGVQGDNFALTHIGIRTEDDGKLAIDSEVDDFADAIADKFEAVQAIFAQSLTTSNSSVELRLGSNGPNVKAGEYDVEITQDPAAGYTTGDALDVMSLAGFNAADETFNAIDASAGDYSFEITVSSQKSEKIVLDGNYSSAEELRADLQSKINGDSEIAKAGGIDVFYDKDTNNFSFVNRNFGQTSGVSISGTSADMGKFGINDSLTETAGIDVSGTINGKAADGSGRTLLAGINDSNWGLQFIVEPGAKDQGAFKATVSRGFAGELDNTIARFVADGGIVDERETRLEKEKDAIPDQKKELDERMTALRERLTREYQAMERILASFDTTRKQLDTILDTLPFTAKNN